MSERQFIKFIADEIRDAVGRLLSGAKVVEVAIEIPGEIRYFSTRVDSVVSDYDYGLSVVTGSVEAVIMASVIANETIIEPHRKDQAFELPYPHVLECSVVKSDPVSWSIPILLDDVSLNRVNSIEIEHNRSTPMFEKIEPEGDVFAQNLIPVRPAVTKAKTGIRAISLNGIVTIRKLPIVLSPSPWSTLDRKIIVEAWDRLKERAKVKLGHDPGKSLEMTAIFLNIDFARVQKATFNKHNRTLHVFARQPDMRKSIQGGNYAIIIGLIRGTGEVLQVAMKLASD